MVICLERCADLHMAQLVPLPLTVSCFSIIQIGFAFLVYRLTWVIPDKGPLNGGCVCGAARLRYDTRCYFNVRSKADMNRLNLPHGDDN